MLCMHAEPMHADAVHAYALKSIRSVRVYTPKPIVIYDLSYFYTDRANASSLGVANRNQGRLSQLQHD